MELRQHLWVALLVYMIFLDSSKATIANDNTHSHTKPNYIASVQELHALKSNNPPSNKPCDRLSEFECMSKAHGIQCLPNKQRCDGVYQCLDQSDERHCRMRYEHSEFTAKCHNRHGSYAPYALGDIFDDIIDSGEISIAPKDYLQCNIQFKNVTNLDLIKFMFEGVGSYAQMVSENIEVLLYYLQANAWITVNSTYFDHDSTQLTTTFVTERNERGIYTNNVKFRIHNIPPKQNQHYALIKNEYLHIVQIKLFGNYMPFYCPTDLVKSASLFAKQVAQWKYIETYKLCNSVPDCVDGSDEIFCQHNGVIAPNKQQQSLGNLLAKRKEKDNVHSNDVRSNYRLGTSHATAMHIDTMESMTHASAHMQACASEMFLHWSVAHDDECVLFFSWKPRNTFDHIVTALVLILMCLVREYVIYSLKYLEIRALTGRYLPFWCNEQHLRELERLHINPLLTKSKISRDRWRTPLTLKLRIADCVLYGLSLTLGYALMLTIMTFNARLMLVIVFGYTCGRFIFYQQQRVLCNFAIGKYNKDRNSRKTLYTADHCHLRS